MDEKISRLEEKANKIEQKSFALEMLEFSKEQSQRNDIKLEKANKRQFTISILLLFCLIVSVGFNIYLLSDTNTITDTIEIQDVETIDNSHIKIGDDIWEKSQ